MYPDLPRLVTQVNQIWFFLKPHTGKVFLGRDSFSVTQWVSPWAFWSVLLLVVVFFFAKVVGKQCQYRYSTQLHRAILNECDKYTKLLWFCPTSRDWSKKLSLQVISVLQLQVLITTFWYFPLFWMAAYICLVLVWPNSLENCSISR